VLAILLLGSAAAAQSTHAASPRVFYVGGQLKIDAANATLGEILSEVAALTGVKIDVPEGVGGLKIPLVTSGPGPAREVLATLLSDSRCDFIIQASDTDPAKIQNVLVIARDQKGSASAAPEMAASSFRSASAASAAPADTGAAPAPEETAAASPPPPDPPAPPPADASDQSMRQKLASLDQSNLPKPAAMSPPAALNQETISQQLVQMYQQRAQMSATPANPGAKPASP
jgi:hypothetical protein